MCESVSVFQTEVSAVLEMIMKLAVVEITKVFRRHLCVSEDVSEDFSPVTDLSTQHSVCSVGVQTGHTSPMQLNDKGVYREEAPRPGEGLSPTEEPSLGFEKTVDMHCTVDLPINIFKEKVDKGERKDDAALQTAGLENPQVDLDPQESGLRDLQVPGQLSSDTMDVSSVNPPPNSLGWSSLSIKEMNFAQPVVKLVKVDYLEAAGEHSQALGKGSDDKNSNFQLSQTSAECTPCSVQLVNLLSVSKNALTPPQGPSTPKDLRVHQRGHTGRRLCCFTECETGVWRLQGGQNRLHGCKICGQKFERKKILRRHERLHTAEAPYSCSRCRKMFAQRKSLKRHERFHTGERPHSCPQCSKSFYLKENLKVHLRFHTGEKPFTCHLCSRAFRIRKNLHKHILHHSMSRRVM